MAEDLFAPVIRMVGRTPEDRAAFRAWLADHDRQMAERIVESLDRLAVVMRYDNGYPVRAVPWASVLDALAPRQDAPDDIQPVPMPTWDRHGPTGRTTADAAPGVSVSAEQVEALAAYLWPLAMANGDETVRAFRIGTARDAVTIALGITVTDGGA